MDEKGDVPSLPHELLVEIVREHPDLVLALLRASTDLPLPVNVTAREASTSIAELHPAEYRADAVLVFSGNDDVPLLAVIVEVQLSVDAEKRFSWPLYLAGVRARLHCPVLLVVLALDDDVGAWSRERIVLGPGESLVTPVVLGAAAVPLVLDAAAALREPELAILSLLAHASTPNGLAIGRAVLGACDHLDEDKAVLYADLVFNRLGAAAIRALENHMDLEHYEIQSEFLRGIIAKNREAAAEEGRKAGRIATLAESVLRVLEVRGLAVPERVQTRLRECTDADVLEEWLRLAVTVDAAEDVIGE